MIPNPYAADLGEREAIEAMRASVDRMRTLMSAWTPAQFERSYAPGKWSARQILVHLAQSEMALGNRARMALTTPNYTSQAFDQDRWMAMEGAGSSGADALGAVAAMNVMNRVLFSSLSVEQRATGFTHPEYGALTV